MANLDHKKKKTKRVTCKKKYRIEKKVRAHHKKLKRTDNKKGTGKEKMVQVPNKCPFKEEILNEAEKHKEKMTEMKAKMREQQKQRSKTARDLIVEKKRATGSGCVAPVTLEALVKQAQSKQSAFEIECSMRVVTEAQLVANEHNEGNKMFGMKTYASIVRKVIENADVVFEVLDARDPMGSRSVSIEKLIVGQGKKLIILLNKIDLVPKEVVQAWLDHFRQEYPCIAFKASTQEQRTKLGRAGVDMSSVSSKCIGADIVMKLLGNYCRNKQVKTSINVGVVGFPNVGKSSVINSLKRKRTCNVGAQPGVTRGLQMVDIGKHIKLVDSPGVVIESTHTSDPVEMALRNVVRIEALADPVSAVTAVLRRCSKQMLMMQYNVADFADVNELLAQIARRMGKLNKGATPNVNAAAKKMLQDWTSGVLHYYCVPPEKQPVPDAQTDIVNQMREEFNLDAVEPHMLKAVQEMPDTPMVDACEYKPEDDHSSVSDVQMVTEACVNKKKKQKALVDDYKIVIDQSLEGNQQLNKKRKDKLKQHKKNKERIVKKADNLGDEMNAQMDMSEPATTDYAFDEHFPKQ